MNKPITLFIFGLVLTLNLNATQSRWINVDSQKPSPANVSLVYLDIESTVLKLSLPGLSLNDVTGSNGTLSVAF